MKKLANTFLVWGIAAALLVALYFAHVDLWLYQADLAAGEGRDWNERVTLPLLLAALELTVLVALNFGRVIATLSTRRALTAVNVAFMVLLAGGIAVLVNVIGFRHYKTFDWTFKNIYTLTERTENVLAHLARPAKVWVVATPAHELYVTVRSTLDMYRAAANGRLEVEYIDPAQDRDRLERTLASLGVNPKEFDEPDVVIFEAEAPGSRLPRTKHIPFREIVEVDFSGGPQGGRLKGFKAEELFTEAVLTVTRDRQTAVYLLTGHQELEPFGRRQDERVSALEKSLKRLSYRVETFQLDFSPGSEKADLPKDCDVLLVLGPRTRFEDREIERLRAYLDRGGRMLVLGDPLLRQRPASRSVYFEETRLDLLLADYGLALEPAYVFDPTSVVIDFAFRPTVDGIAANHRVTKPLVGLKLLMNVAQPVAVSPIEELGSRVRNQAILETTTQAIAIKDMDAVQRTGDPFAADHRKGPITLAAVATKDIEASTATARGEARILVAGDATLATDDVVEAVPANMDFILNAISWLAAREESIAIGSKTPEVIRLRLDEDQKTRVRLVALIELPLACAIFALLVYLARRST